MSEAINRVIEYLAGQFSRERPVLFTGAGFSLGVKDKDGVALPSAGGLVQELWALCRIEGDAGPDSSLQDVFELALKRNKPGLESLLHRRFNVDPQSLTHIHELWFLMNWSRVYTLNIDTLAMAASMRFPLPRRPIHVTPSGLLSRSTGTQSNELQVIQLNGGLSDPVENLTFSTTQYAERGSSTLDPCYQRLTADLLTHPVVFVGTRLDEPALWHHIHLRRQKSGNTGRELRPGSFIVTPQLAPARQSLLEQYNVEWIGMTSDEFANTVLEPVRQLLETAPYVAMRHKKSERAAREGELRIVSELAGEDPNRKTAFLLGQEPHWSDLVTERAIKRDIDAQLFDLAMGGIGGKKSTTVAVTGTAGSGKSASLMRVCLGLSNGGHKVGYVDRDTDISPQQIRRQLAEGTDITVLAIDDADRYGEYMMPLVDEMSRLRPGLLTILGVRSSRSDALDASMLRYSQLREVSIPHLSDSDIDGLIDTLERNSLLGRLKGKDRETQRQLFKRESGRQLLVAMIQATSGRKFEEKISEELDDYGDEERFLYGLVAVVSDRNLSIAKEELLIASGHPDNDTLNRLERLTRRGAIVEREGRFTTRHREIARVLVERFAAERTLDALIGPIVFAVASTVSQSGHRNSREWRILKRLLSHRHLARVVNDPPRVRGIFERVETLLGWDYHMWLQRGAFEVQQGDLALAENYLGQAFALNDEDSLVVTEYAHLGFRIALENPRSPKAAGRISDATEVLETQIREQGDRDFYPYHVLGSQGLAWSRRAGMGREERRLFLKRILAHVEEGVLRHPHQTDLADLQRDLKREVLLTHVV